jgi:hypothetical protein
MSKKIAMIARERQLKETLINPEGKKRAWWRHKRQNFVCIKFCAERDGS